VVETSPKVRFSSRLDFFYAPHYAILIQGISIFLLLNLLYPRGKQCRKCHTAISRARNLPPPDFICCHISTHTAISEARNLSPPDFIYCHISTHTAISEARNLRISYAAISVLILPYQKQETFLLRISYTVEKNMSGQFLLLLTCLVRESYAFCVGSKYHSYPHVQVPERPVG